MTRNVVTDTALVSLVQRIIACETDRRDAAAAIKDIYTEAKSSGHSVKALRLVVKRQLETAEQRSTRVETEETAELIEARLGQLSDTPLGSAAKTKARAGAEAH